jgi:Tfp pilus assembly protein PilN
MLRTNLATRPFYNDSLVHAILVVVAVAALAFTVFNAARIATLRGGQGEVGTRADLAEQRAESGRQAAEAARTSLKAKDLDAVAAEAREANDIIDSRSFSWTELFNQLETTLPDDVRIVSVTPRVERDGRLTIAMIAVSRQAEDVNEFIRRLEATKAFANLMSHQENTNQDGMLETVLEGQYLRSPGRSAAKGQP